MTRPQQSTMVYPRLLEQTSSLHRPRPGQDNLNRPCGRSYTSGSFGPGFRNSGRGVMAVAWNVRILGILLLHVSFVTSLVQYPPPPPPPAVPGTECPTEQLAQYRVVLETFWSREDFPKHYPQWRPHAQWTKLLGVSHSFEHTVFREGALASQPLKEFVETGRSDQLDTVTYASQGPQVLDAFYAPAIEEGVGTTQAKFFADGNHSRVSMVAKIVPSPDWFIGVDSLQLCSAGHWLNATSIQLSPMDAGTDQGLAFTSPSWKLSPPDPIRRITHDWPRHPAASFAYPNKSSLPTLASLSIVKIREYRLVKPSSAVKVPLPVYDSSTSRERVDGQSATTTTERQRENSHTIPDDFHGHSSGINRNRNTDHSGVIETGHTLPELSADFGRSHSRDTPSVSRGGISSGEKPSIDKYRGSTSVLSSHETSDNQPSHDSPTLPDGRTYSVAVSHSVSFDSRTSSRARSSESISSNDVAVTLAESAKEDQEQKASLNNLLPHDLPYNEVLPREQYDRETLEQQQRREQALQHHQKLQQLLIEKRKKLKEKKRKHKERKLAAAARMKATTLQPERPEVDGEEEEVEEPGLNLSRRRQYKSSSLRVIPKGDAMSVIDNIVESYQRDQRRKRRQQRREERRRRRMLNRLNGVQPHRGKHAVDCEVDEWSGWSQCSKTCGIGEQVRKREVKQHPRRGGTKCPIVVETTWCGSARDCHRDYFRW